MEFELHAPFQPTGDQPEAIRQLVDGINNGVHDQVLLGATGTGKTYTIASVIEQIQKPTLVMAHNKTLAAQLYAEFKDFFPDNAVEYFVSYYDYYQPEAYMPVSGLYIEKDFSVNEEIERLNPVLMALKRHNIVLSIDSFQQDTQRFGLSENVHFLNDIQGFPYPEIYDELADSN